MTAAAPIAVPPFRAWLLAARPKTLTAAVVPVVVGTGLALGQGLAALWPALAALGGAVLIQIGTNLTNDYYDFRKGADTAERIGPVRVTQSGGFAGLTRRYEVEAAKLDPAQSRRLDELVAALPGSPAGGIQQKNQADRKGHPGGPGRAR